MFAMVAARTLQRLHRRPPSRKTARIDGTSLFTADVYGSNPSHPGVRAMNGDNMRQTTSWLGCLPGVQCE
jgi:hypothetical protein